MEALRPRSSCPRQLGRTPPRYRCTVVQDGEAGPTIERHGNHWHA
jgi:hypothetical protein